MLFCGVRARCSCASSVNTIWHTVIASRCVAIANRFESQPHRPTFSVEFVPLFSKLNDYRLFGRSYTFVSARRLKF